MGGNFKSPLLIVSGFKWVLGVTESPSPVTHSPAHIVGRRAVSPKAKHHIAHEHLLVIV